ncbi:SusF/SusE family outer membrane protein [Bacteroides sp. 519]|uniref:SusF/SusE family outer membrane protein n=1 Tax=Bacteroides sp. 519 TaxID=2302937 RepID=UPI0013D6627E|nr:SusF/SusE family outer membrane protein [Bacteroides sp. 519]NDV57494.1 SusF/SusE family outer membrane protein [Bacteroides sp. 519]
MKPYKILSLLALLLVGWSCTDENNTEYNKGEAPLEVIASKETIELDALNPSAEAVKFTWTSGTNYGTGLAIDYTFQLDKQDGTFENGITVEMGRNNFEKSYKNEELNDLLIEKFGITAAAEATFQYRVIANVASNAIEQQISPVQTLGVKTHKPITKNLYLIGDATPNGWNAGEATELKPVTNTPKAFSWTGPLSAGEFKFITTLGEFMPSYNKGENDTKLVLRESDDAPDDKFVITEGGTYTIRVNLISMAISITRGEGPEFTELWFVGNPTGWSFQPMTVNPLDPFVFHYNDDLSAGGEFKIGTVAGSWDAVFFRPTNDQQTEGTKLDVDKWAGDPDYKWNITGGAYKIKLDTRDKKIDIVPFTPYTMIYLVGDATPSGWDIGNATPMKAGSDPYIFTWTGNLNSGELKFTLDKQDDWNGAWFIASEADKTPTGETEQMIYNYPGAGVDYKWRISEAGTYTIELNQLKETVKIKKQ